VIRAVLVTGKIKTRHWAFYKVIEEANPSIHVPRELTEDGTFGFAQVPHEIIVRQRYRTQ
jgi:hypothetical protein